VQTVFFSPTQMLGVCELNEQILNFTFITTKEVAVLLLPLELFSFLSYTTSFSSLWFGVLSLDTFSVSFVVSSFV